MTTIYNFHDEAATRGHPPRYSHQTDVRAIFAAMIAGREKDPFNLNNFSTKEKNNVHR